MSTVTKIEFCSNETTAAHAKKIEEAIAAMENLPAARTDNAHKARVGVIFALRRSLAWGYSPLEALTEVVLCKPVEKASAAAWLRQASKAAQLLGVIAKESEVAKPVKP